MNTLILVVILSGLNLLNTLLRVKCTSSEYLSRNKITAQFNCPHCGSSQLGKAGFSVKGIQRYSCKNNDCKTNTFMLEYSNKAYAVGVKKKIVEMAINGSGIRDTVRLLCIHKDTVINELKKRKQPRYGPALISIN